METQDQLLSKKNENSLYRLKLLEDILTTINSVESSQEILSYLIDRCIELTGAVTGSIMLINDKNTLEIKVFRGLIQEKISSTRLKVGEGVTGRVAQTGKPLLINSVNDVEYYVRIRPDLQAELAVPLKIGNDIIGVINVDSNKTAAFTEEHMEILELIGNLASQILQKAQLISKLQERIERQDILLAIVKILEESTDLNDIFDRLIQEISREIHIKRGMLILLNEKNELNIFSGYRLSEDAMKRGVYKIGEGIIGQVVKNGKNIFIKDINKNKTFLNRMKIRRSKTEQNSFFAVPIKYENKTIGVFSLEKTYYNDTDFTNTTELLILIGYFISNRVQTYEHARREKEQLIQKNLELKNEILNKGKEKIFLGKNKKIFEIIETVNTIADTDATVLITGQTGTGKQVFARMIHDKSNRCDESFISINCAAIPENLLESELFGFKKGAFTGAINDKKGKFLLANKGTLFLDEIGDLNIYLQAKILKVIQEKVIEPLGSEKSKEVDVRIIAATNHDLEKQVSENKFREDLFYRLNVINLHLPALQERKDDLPLFINHFISFFSLKYNKKIQGISDQCLQILQNHHWPGNIRELENVIERSVILSKTPVIEIDVLPENIRRKLVKEEKNQLEKIILSEIKQCQFGSIYKEIIKKIEKHLIDFALIQSNHKQVQAAEILGLNRNTLHAKMKEFIK